MSCLVNPLKRYGTAGMPQRHPIMALYFNIFVVIIGLNSSDICGHAVYYNTNGIMALDYCFTDVFFRK